MALADRLLGLLGLTTKAAEAAPVSGRVMPYAGFFSGLGAELTPHQAWSLYTSVATLAKVIDLIADQAAVLKPNVRIDGQLLREHDILTLLAKPGYNRTRRRLVKEAAVQHLVTGTGYIHATGSVRGLPVALDVLPTKHMTILEGDEGWPESYRLTEARRSIAFQRVPGRDARYLQMFGEVALGELVPVYDMAGEKKGVGLSRLQAVRTDVDLKAKGLQHNSSLLARGARLSGVFSIKERVDQKVIDQIKADLRDSAMGASNAGSVLVSSGGSGEFTSMMMMPRDMDWANLAKIVDEAIIARFNVPTTLFSVDAQTYNNYEAAWRAFYDNAVLPCFEIVYGGLAQMFSERLQAEVEIVHDELSNPVLAKQAAERAKAAKDSQLITTNEGREIIGYEPLLGGDTISGPPGLVPEFQDLFTGLDAGTNENADAERTDHDRTRRAESQEQPRGKPH